MDDALVVGQGIEDAAQDFCVDDAVGGWVHNNYVGELFTAVPPSSLTGEAARHPRHLRVDASSGDGVFDGRSRTQTTEFGSRDRSVRCAGIFVGRHWFAVVGVVVIGVGRGVVVGGVRVGPTRSICQRSRSHRRRPAHPMIHRRWPVREGRHRRYPWLRRHREEWHHGRLRGS